MYLQSLWLEIAHFHRLVVVLAAFLQFWPSNPRYFMQKSVLQAVWLWSILFTLPAAEGHLDLNVLAMHPWNKPNHTPLAFCLLQDRLWAISHPSLLHYLHNNYRSQNVGFTSAEPIILRNVSVPLPWVLCSLRENRFSTNAITSSQHSCAFQSNGERDCALLGFCSKTQHLSSICKIIALMTHSQPTLLILCIPAQELKRLLL